MVYFVSWRVDTVKHWYMLYIPNACPKSSTLCTCIVLPVGLIRCLSFRLSLLLCRLQHSSSCWLPSSCLSFSEFRKLVSCLARDDWRHIRVVNPVCALILFDNTMPETGVHGCRADLNIIVNMTKYTCRIEHVAIGSCNRLLYYTGRTQAKAVVSFLCTITLQLCF